MEYNGNEVLRVTNPHICISWLMGNWCNFKCAYCFDHANLGTHYPPVVDDTLIKNITHLVKEIRKGDPDRQIRWNLTGGEPTAQKGFGKLLSVMAAADDNSYVSVVTNGTRPIAWWEKNIQYVHRLIVSVHPESDIQHTIKLLKAVNGKCRTVTFSVMLGSQNFDDAIAKYKSLMFTTAPEYGLCNVVINTLRRTSRNDAFTPLTQEQHGIIKNLVGEYLAKKDRNTTPLIEQLPEDLVRRTLITPHTIETEETGVERFFPVSQKNSLKGTFSGYKCLAPQEWIEIDERGELGRLSCKARVGPKTNIFDLNFVKEYKAPTHEMTCRTWMPECNCIGLLETGKYLPLTN